MAPSSRVWPYLIDDRNFGRTFMGPKEFVPELLQVAGTVAVPPTLSPSTGKGAELKMTIRENVSGQAKKGNKVKKKRATKTGSNIAGREGLIQRGSVDAQQTTVLAGAIKERPTRPAIRKPQTKGNIDANYLEMLERNIDLRHKGRLEESHLIQAAINVSIMLSWKEIDVLDVVEKLERAITIPKEQRKYSSRMMEVIGEIERLRVKEWTDRQELQQLRETFKGRFYGGIEGFENATPVATLRAPGLLMSLQAAISVAFLQSLDAAAVENKSFDVDVFGARSVLYLRVPNRACIEERKYLMQMSQLDTTRKDDRSFTACPGIERAINDGEKQTVLDKVRTHIEGGSEILDLGVDLFCNLGITKSVREGEGILRDSKIVQLSDEGVLALEYVYRKRVGFPIILGDQLDGDEEVEEENEEGDSEEDESSRALLPCAEDAPELGQDIEFLQVADTLHPSLVVKLRYRAVGT